MVSDEHLEPTVTSGVFEPPPLESGGAKLSDKLGGALSVLLHAVGISKPVIATKGEATTPGGTTEQTPSGTRYAPHSTPPRHRPLRARRSGRWLALLTSGGR